MSNQTLLSLDNASREHALAADGSFIVRAPAGSGKTELLIQRVLALLATVDAPEEVVAITFTRKAAAEMKDRLLKALAIARTGIAPDQPHQFRTYTLARVVCERDSERCWNIAGNPGRLRVQTIDALAQWLARQLPLTLGLGAAPSVTERADELYAAAARKTLGVLDSRTPTDRDTADHVARLLGHLDNDVGRAVALLSAMLARRDQWLRHLGGPARAELETSLRRACEGHMQRVCEAVPAAAVDELISLARYASANVSAAGLLSPCADLTALPEVSIGRLGAWRGLASLLLTNDGHWRARFTRAEGFPAGATTEERRRLRPYKQRIARLLESLRDNDALRLALHDLRALPPAAYTEDQWSLIESIATMLRRAAAELAVVFAETGLMDFAEVTRRAVAALGDERGSDIAMALDARIRHLLVDEFQDTSITQFELIERLVADWSPGDGRTLFVVGDPMQSIYRFREAEVGLFLRAWERGIGPVRLQPLQLARNFRSQHGVVEWVNQAFALVLPPRSDVASGAVSFEPAVAVHGATLHPPVVVHPLIGGSPEDEAAVVTRLVRALRADDPSSTIALLVRARSHLVEIAYSLRAAGLKPTAVELDALTARPMIGDLLVLTRALEHGADRVAWLAVLRAPWCGLTLADLAAVAEADPSRTIPELLDDADCRARLSPDGAARVVRVGPVLRRASALREKLRTSRRVEQAWLLLGGPACFGSEASRREAEQFFAHLARHEDEHGGLVDVVALEQSLRLLFAASDTASDPAFQVMTIHKAKGLEFDHVIVPRLAAIPRRDEAQLMIWLERASHDGSELLLAPIHAGGAEKDALVQWIEGEIRMRQRHEDERLAYVAATRARHQLHWVASVKRDASGELSRPETSLLARLWPALQQAFLAAPDFTGSGPKHASDLVLDQSLRRLPAAWTLPQLPTAARWSAGSVVRDAGSAIEFSWAGETARRIGTVVHRWLQRMAEDGLAGWDVARVKTIAPQIERALAAGGLSGTELQAARARVTQALINAVQDERGRWVLGSHPEHRSELRLSVMEGGIVRRLVLDRTFVTAGGVRWIVDYKVGAHEGANVEDFLDVEQQRYRAQLETYGTALDPQAQLGLYFPLVPGWREWRQSASVSSEGPASPVPPTDII
jgi:ATP-dependent helicase/nuclease subunit A